MATNLDINERLLEEAYKLGGFKTKKAVVNAALAEFVQHHKQLQILSLFGKIEYDVKHNYKNQRRRS